MSLNKFPSGFKSPKIKPIFEKNQKINVSNYRQVWWPIALILTCIINAIKFNFEIDF